MNRRERRVNDRLDGTLWGEARKAEQSFRKAVEWYRQEHLEGREHGLTSDVSTAVFNGWAHTCNGVPGVIHKWGGTFIGGLG